MLPFIVDRRLNYMLSSKEGQAAKQGVSTFGRCTRSNAYKLTFGDGWFAITTASMWMADVEEDSTMRITLLGTGTTHPTRANTAIHVKFMSPGAHAILLDAAGGWELLQNLYKAQLDPAEIRKIFVSHLHFDHCLGLPGLLFMGAEIEHWQGPVSVYGSKRTINGLQRVITEVVPHSGHTLEGYVDWKCIRSGSVVDIGGGSNVQAFSLSHAEGSLGFVVQSPSNRKVAYVADTRYVPSIAKQIGQVDILLSEVFCLDEEAEKAATIGHLTARQSGMIAREARAGSLVMIHLPGQLSAAEDELLNEANSVFDGRVMLGHDLQQISVPMDKSGDSGVGST